MAVTLGLMGKPLHRAYNLLTGITIHAIARRCAKVTHSSRAFQPMREEGRDHMIAHCELAYSFADGFDNARAVRHGNTPIFGGNHSGDHSIVMKIQ